MRRQTVKGLYATHIPEFGLSPIKNMVLVKALREESEKIRTVFYNDHSDSNTKHLRKMTWKSDKPVRGCFSRP